MVYQDLWSCIQSSINGGFSVVEQGADVIEYGGAGFRMNNNNGNPFLEAGAQAINDPGGLDLLDEKGNPFAEIGQRAVIMSWYAINE